MKALANALLSAGAGLVGLLDALLGLAGVAALAYGTWTWWQGDGGRLLVTGGLLLVVRWLFQWIITLLFLLGAGLWVFLSFLIGEVRRTFWPWGRP